METFFFHLKLIMIRMIMLIFFFALPLSFSSRDFLFLLTHGLCPFNILDIPTKSQYAAVSICGN